MIKNLHVKLFKKAFSPPENTTWLLQSILPAPLSEAIDWATLAPVDGTFIRAELADYHSDLLFTVDIRGGRAFAYLLFEHQSANDDSMPLHVLSCQVRIWEHFRKQSAGPLPPIIPVVLSCVNENPRSYGSPPGFVRFLELFEPRLMTIPGLGLFVPDFGMLEMP